VRRQDWAEQYKGLPLLATVVDPRGLEVKRVPLSLDDAGFAELRYKTQETSPTGKYTASVYSAKDGRPKSFLGSTTVQVREFLPDTMKLKVTLNKETQGGWVNPGDLKAQVLLTNLYGTPREGARVRVMLRLKPGLPPLPAFPGYRFFDPLQTREPHEEKLPDADHGGGGELVELPQLLDRNPVSLRDAVERLSLLHLMCRWYNEFLSSPQLARIADAIGLREGLDAQAIEAGHRIQGLARFQAVVELGAFPGSRAGARGCLRSGGGARTGRGEGYEDEGEGA